MDVKRYYEKNPHLKPPPKSNDEPNTGHIQYPPGYLESLNENDLQNLNNPDEFKECDREAEDDMKG